jgi:HlyD family secretion protein
MKRKRFRWILPGALVAAAVGGYFIYRAYFSPEQETPTQTLQTAIVTRGDIVLSASGAGQVIANQEISLGFSTSGTLEELNARVGDPVSEGEVLAVLGDIEELKATVASDQLSLITAQQALEDLYNSADLTKAQAWQTVVTAKATLDDAIETRQAYDCDRCKQSTIDSYFADVILAREEVAKLQEEYDKEYAWRSEDDISRANKILALDTAKETYDSALANYNYCMGIADTSEIDAADAAAQVAQAEYDDAMRAWEKVKDSGIDEDELVQAQENVNSAQAKLDSSNKQLEGTKIVAPFDATVMSIDASVGDVVGTTAFITLADLSTPTIEIYLDESDLNQVKIDNTIEVIFDILPDDVFYGNITRVDPGLVTSANVQYVYAQGTLDQQDQPSPLPGPLTLGLNASVDVISAQTQNALLVPLEALRDLGNDKYAVFVQENGELRLHAVEVGLQDVTYAEIKSGLNEGDVVSTGIVATR